MRIEIYDGLPIVTVSVSYKGKTIELNDVLLDTGCSTAIFDTDEKEILDLQRTL